MASEAAMGAFEAIDAALAVLHAEVAASAARVPEANDPLAAVADECLDILAGVAQTEARVSALKADAAARYADSARSIAAPGMPVQAQEMAIAAEVGCVLAIGDRAAGALLSQSYALSTTLPRTLAALRAGTVSWQHARVMVEETATLDRDAAAALETHFLDPDAPDAARGCPPGEMPAYRFRRKARIWRERNHPHSIETRHAKGVADRCLEYAPEQDGMARVSAYLPAHQANAIWNRITAVARGLQGRDEERTLTQLRADLFAAAALRGDSGCIRCTGAGDNASSSADDGGTRGPADAPAPRAEVLVTVPVFAAPSLVRPTSLQCWMATDRSRPRWRGSWWPAERTPSTGCSWTRATVHRWKSAVPATGSLKPCGTGFVSGTESAHSPDAATTPSTTRPTTCWPGTTAEPPESATWDSPAPSTTG